MVNGRLLAIFFVFLLFERRAGRLEKKLSPFNNGGYCWDLPGPAQPFSDEFTTEGHDPGRGLFYNEFRFPFAAYPTNMSNPSSTLAAQADLFALYQESMQDADFEVEFVDTQYRALRNRAPRVVREDFCGTGALTAAWVRHDTNVQAHAVDERGDMLEWGRARNLSAAGLAERAHLHLGDVTSTATPAADVVTAFNFAYSRFKTRAALRAYFEAARARLTDDGMLVIDAFGGTDVMGQTVDETELEAHDAVFVWDQEHFNPITNELLTHIHFEFADGSELENAFTLDWRIWSLPELHELLLEAGFKKVRIFWEKFVSADDLEDDEDDEDLEDDELDDEDEDELDDEEDEDEDEEDDDFDLDDFDDVDELIGTGEFFEATDVENQEAWVAYIIAEK